MHTCSICLNIYTLGLILVLRSSCGADYRYEACGPRSCGKGPNISFPFYIEGLQNPYCGFPEFMLNCSHGFPVLHWSDTEYIVKDISYETRSLRVYDSAVLSSDSNDGCVPTIRNVSIPTAQFDFVNNVTKLHLFSNCSDSVFKDDANVVCDGGRNLALYEGDESVTSALQNCAMNSVAPVEDDRGVAETAEVVEVLRRGFVMKWRASDCSKCESSGGRCGFNETTYLFRCFCPNRPRYRSCRSEKDGSTLIRAAAIFGGAVCLLVCLFITFLVWQCKKRSENASDISQSDVVERKSFYFGSKIFSYKELMDATNSFDSSKEVGHGGYGTVYQGKLSDGREVAVKRLHEHNYRRMEQFMNEIKILTCLRHKNLVSLYGCTSASSKELLLVYEYVVNGTVSDHLHGGKPPLTWPNRMRIAIETAEALAYLHKSDIIHRDVKTSNILLDINLCVKLADFGLSRLSCMDATHVSTAPQGTPGYVDPSYHKSYHLSSKSDVYSFGVVLVELVSSRPAVDISRRSDEINLASLAVSWIQRGAFVELVDEFLGVGVDAEIARMTTAVAELAFRCLQAEKEMRPCMDEVLSVLNEICEGRRELGVEMRNDDSCDLERDDVVVVMKREFESSPNAETDLWVSHSTAINSCSKSVEM